MNVLDLFSGIGGFSLGLERAGMRTVAFCEIEPYCRAVLKKHWPHVPCYEDVRELTKFRLDADGISVDLICGGFPCQDISVAGAQKGFAGERSSLWSEIARLVDELRPRYLIVENVTNLLAGERGTWFGRVLGDLAEIGFDAEWHCIPAADVGLPQGRDRVWIIAYPDCRGREGLEKRNGIHPRFKFGLNPDGLALAQRRARDGRSWVRRADDGLPNRVDRTRALGNAVVPQIPEIIGRAIMQAEGLA